MNSVTRRDRVADALVEGIDVAFRAMAGGRRRRPQCLEICQVEPSRPLAIEKLETLDRGDPEFAEGDDPVEIRIGGRDWFGHIEEAIAGSALEAAADAQYGAVVLSSWPKSPAGRSMLVAVLLPVWGSHARWIPRSWN
jgi:hypothetical protein